MATGSLNPGFQKRRARQKDLRHVLRNNDIPALEALGRWWMQDQDCLGDSLLCHVLKQCHVWALERLLAVGVPVCWRTVRQASSKIAHPGNLEDLRAVWPLLMPAVQADASLRSTLIQELVGPGVALDRIPELRLGEVFGVCGWEEPLEFRIGVELFPRFTPLQWAMKKRQPALGQVLLSEGASYEAVSPQSDWPTWTLKYDLEDISPSHAFWGSLVTTMERRVRAAALQQSLPEQTPALSIKPRF